MNEIIITIQSAISIYILYLLVLYKEGFAYIVSYLIIFLFFILLKFQIIFFPFWSFLDYLVWGIYNVLIYIFFIFYINKKNYGRNITPNNKV